MKKRCYNPKDNAYHLYGGRGIKICDRWLGEEGFLNFAADMGKPDHKKMSIDRIDNDGDYSPENCRWVDGSTQNNNTRVNTKITYQGKTLTIAEWADLKGITYSCLFSRYKKGWTPEEILNTEIREFKKYEYRGEVEYLAYFAKKYNISHDTLITRVAKLGWDIQTAIEKPLRNQPETRIFQYKGQSGDLSYWSRITGIKAKTIDRRLRLGWSIEEALTKPLGEVNNPHYKLHPFEEELLSIREIARRTGINRSTLMSKLKKGISLEQILDSVL